MPDADPVDAADPLTTPPPPVRRLPAWRVLVPATIAGLLIGVVGIALRSDPAPRGASDLVSRFAPLPGYEVLDDSRAGAGPVPIEGAGRAMTSTSAPNSLRLADAGYLAGHSRAWGRPAGEPPRAVVVFVSEYADAGGARTVLGWLRDSGAPRLDVSGAPPGATAYRDQPDTQGRAVQRVAFVEGRLLYVVSLITPPAAEDPAELGRVARQIAEFGDA